LRREVDVFVVFYKGIPQLQEKLSVLHSGPRWRQTSHVHVVGPAPGETWLLQGSFRRRN
jgi:hypothetical protein